MTRQGTWAETSGGGLDLSFLIPAAAAAGVAFAVFEIVMALEWWLIGLTIAAPVAYLASWPWRARRKAADLARITANRQAIEAEDRQRELERHQRRLEIEQVKATAQAQAIVPLVAALTAAMHCRQPYPQPEPYTAAPVLRGQVER